MIGKLRSGCVRKSLVLDMERDVDLVRWLDAQPNVSEAIRAALRAYISAYEVTLLSVYEAVKALEVQLRNGAWVPSPDSGTADEDPDLAAQLDRLGL
ncbi:MAG: hypothetical protein JW892_07995 [Anaerolineae bacterium]|nr:hypothetical protein [Anaerolineae bacterium]